MPYKPANTYNMQCDLLLMRQKNVFQYSLNCLSKAIIKSELRKSVASSRNGGSFNSGRC